MDEDQGNSRQIQAEEPTPTDEGGTVERADQLSLLLAKGELEEAVSLLTPLHPADQVEVLKELGNESQRKLLPLLTPEQMAQIFEHLEPEEAAAFAAGIEPPFLPQILDASSPDVAADILRQLPTELSQEALETMVEARDVIPLLQYPDDSAGGLMTPEYPVARRDTTTDNALDVLRLLGPAAEDISSIFVLDEDNRLVGSLSIARLALARPRTQVGDIAEADVISVTSDTDQEECVRLMERYGLGRLPVVDSSRRLVGVIHGEDLVDVAEEEATEDMFKIAGIPGERALGPLGRSVAHRLPWLYVNLGTAFMAALVISAFESTIARVVALAVFLPVIAGQGGIAGTQTLTLVVRSMALGELRGRRGVRLLWRELVLGLLHGALLGLVVGVVGGLWKGNPYLGLVLGAAMVGNMLVAGLAGAGVPLALRRLGVDPAVGAAVIVTTFTDVLGFALFLGLAAALVGFLD